MIVTRGGATSLLLLLHAALLQGHCLVQGAPSGSAGVCGYDAVFVTQDATRPVQSVEEGCFSKDGEVAYLGQQSVLIQEDRRTRKDVVNLWRTNRTTDEIVFVAYEELEDFKDSAPWKARLGSIVDALNSVQQSALGPKSGTALNLQTAWTYKEMPGKEHVGIIRMEDSYAILRVPTSRGLISLSDRLPRDTRMTRLVNAQLDSTTTASSNVSLPSLTFKPPLHALLFSRTLDVPFLQKDAMVISGEDKYGQSIPLDQTDDSIIGLDLTHWGSRHSATAEARLAAAWIRARMARDLTPIHGSCVQWNYDEIFSPNVVCTIPPGATSAKNASDDGIVLISAHYDSRGSFGSVKAPGADDDGSGTTMLLALARHLGSHRIRFEREVRLVAFSGEEQGLVGSQHYAAHLRNESVPIRFQLQTDMIGYRKPDEPLQVAFPDRLATEEATQYVMSVARMYVPELQLGFTPACCSDHQSFWEQGYTSTWIFERRGPIADPCYHDSCDRTDRPGYDFDQIRAATRLVLATLLDVAGGVHWPW